MIRGKCILCMPLTTWDSPYTNTVVKMMSLLSRENKILFVDYQYSYKDIYSTFRGKKNIPLKRILGIEPRLRKVTTEYGSEIFVLNPPPVLPSNGIQSRDVYKWVLKLNASLVKSSIQSALKELKMNDLIVINGYNPFLGLNLIGSFDEQLHVYYCYDEIKGDIWYKYHGPAIEEEYMKKADLVVTTSDALQDSKACINSNCYVVKNGVDFSLFNSKAKTYEHKSTKVVAYTGSIDERFDIDLMTYVVSQLPTVSFEFLGRVTNPLAKQVLEKYANVKFLGSRAPKEVPDYLRNVDACIIPYLKNEVTWGVYPLKINEYLAMGKPVVMTSFAPLLEFKNIVSIVDDKEAFVKGIEFELGNDSESKQNVRIETARKNSWENKAEELSSILEEFLVQKKEMV